MESHSNFDKKVTEKLISIDQAMDKIKSNDRIIASMAAAEPQGFLESIADYAHKFQNLELYCANPSKPYRLFTEAKSSNIHTSVLFLTSSVYPHHGHDAVHYMPQHLSQWFRNMTQRGSLDVFWGTCSVPDPRGFVSLGTGACYESEAIRSAKYVILEINPHIPLTYGATIVPITEINNFIFNPHPLPSPIKCKITECDIKIGEFVAELVQDGATIQLGIGAIPDAIGKSLARKKNLGVHTEMINDAIMDLIEKGVIDGSKKTLWPGRVIGAFAFGSEKLYQFIDRNPLIELHPASVVNDSYRIGRNHKMTSINTAIEIDITGQVCSESIGHRELSGVGGASDTHIGAQRSDGGIGIIAMHSTARGKSKIVFELQPGAKVSISRNDLDTVVTEYGVASLRGRSVSERAKSLISIAHPTFRDELLFQAKQLNYI